MQRATRALALAGTLSFLGACEDGGGGERWLDLGEVPPPAATALNHTPMIVSGDRVLVGTSNGIWSRPHDRPGDWALAGLDGVAVFATRRHPTLEATLFAAGQPVSDLQSAPFYRSDDGGTNWVPATSFPRSSFDESTERFFDLAVAPDDPDRLYANLSGPSVAISTDGGLNWTLANGETEVFFGDPCVIHILPARPELLYQGCEAPLDIAWVATHAIDPADPFELENFTFVAGGPDLALENRRPNAMGSGPASPEVLYVGLEGALIDLDESGFEFVFRAEEGAIDPPYAYITAIWADPDDADHLIFGGGVNGENTMLALFETRDRGETMRRIREPRALVDPAVEQVVAVGDDALAVLISHVANPGDESRRLELFMLEGVNR